MGRNSDGENGERALADLLSERVKKAYDEKFACSEEVKDAFLSNDG